MGDFKVEVNAVGGHGCQRELKDGERVPGCGSMRCPDCLAAKFVADLAKIGCSVKGGTITHWPGTPGQVVDEFLVGDDERLFAQVTANRRRHGSF